ncbi:MAG: RecQ family ATP-dependent DNA helicase [Chloroflexi bacterium]|nr:RecQ family ATP-dependent DNA helicase [Chloroflexota bacterium]
MDYDAQRALQLLRIGSSIPDAQFRDGQEDAIRHVVEGRGKLLVVQKTGWGKSFVYFIATKMLREGGAGPALLISPLLALMRNQIAAAERMGVRAVTINSDNTNQWDDVMAQARRDEVDILLISPERLANDSFREDFLPDISGRVSMLVIDEAHCISDWGHDFRPDYRRIERIARTLPENIQLLGTTATANKRVMDDLEEILGPDITTMRGDLNRPSLMLQTIRMRSQAERLAWLAERLPELPGSGIIYTLTRRDARQVSDWLQSQGLNVQPYMGGSRNQEERDGREQLEDALLENRVKALASTVALGMGYDKPDLAFVIHYQTPSSVVHYYQQVGRAGRGLEAAHGVLLSGVEDTEITDFFIRSAFPTREEVRQVIAALADEQTGLSVPQLLQAVNINSGRLDRAIKLLSLEAPAPIAKKGTRWQLIPVELNNDFWERAERLTALRQAEQQQMQEYVALDSGHMEFLIRALDGNSESAQTPNISPLSTNVSPETVLQAVEFLHRTRVPIQARKRWPNGGSPGDWMCGNIRKEQQAEDGFALCYWRDAGWGNLVYSGKYIDNRFSDELVAAAAEMMREWQPQPTLDWVTCIPSRRHPYLVPDFAERLADTLGLPFRSVLVKTDDRPEQKDMENSAQQAHNVEGSLGFSQNQVLPGPALLVDDMVDSGWTFTVAAALLRERGCSAVFPFALADTGSRQG